VTCWSEDPSTASLVPATTEDAALLKTGFFGQENTKEKIQAVVYEN
jgi:hypothetical protein